MFNTPVQSVPQNVVSAGNGGAKKPKDKESVVDDEKNIETVQKRQGRKRRRRGKKPAQNTLEEEAPE